MKWFRVVVFVLGFSLGAAAQEAGGASRVETSTDLLDCVLPIEDSSKPGLRWSIAVRVVPAFEPEWLIKVSQEASGRVDVEFVGPAGYRIADQLKRIPPDSTCTTIRPMLQLKRCATDSTRSGRLIGLAKEFERQRWPATPNADLVFDATRYEARVQGFQDEVRLLLHDHGGRGSHPLVGWTAALRKTIRTCDGNN